MVKPPSSDLALLLLRVLYLVSPGYPGTMENGVVVNDASSVEPT